MIKNAKYKNNFQNNAKKCKSFILTALFMVILIVFAFFKTEANFIVFAEDEGEKENQEQILSGLKIETENQLNKLEFDELDEQLAAIGVDEDYSLFSGLSFKDIVEKIVAGEFVADFGTIFSAIKNSVVLGIKHTFSILIVCVVLCLMFAIYKEMLTNNKLNFISIIRLIFFLIVVFLLLSVSISVIKKSTSAILSMQKQMNIIFPILISLMASSGGVVSVNCYSPALGFMSQVVSNIFIYFLLPLFVFTLVLNIAEQLSESKNFSGLKNFFSSLFKWTLGILCTSFLSVLTIEGVVSGVADGISLKATKYAIKNYVPYLGGYVSDGFALIKASSVILKNAVGFAAVLLLLITTLAPVLSIAVLTICINLISAITAPIGGGEVSNFLHKFSSSFKMLLAVVLGVSLMYFYILCLSVLTINFI